MRAIVSANNMEELVKFMGYPLDELKIREANWNGTEFKRGKLVRD